MSTSEKTGPLRGIRVLDFTLFQAGGLATTILAAAGFAEAEIERLIRDGVAREAPSRRAP